MGDKEENRESEVSFEFLCKKNLQRKKSEKERIMEEIERKERIMEEIERKGQAERVQP